MGLTFETCVEGFVLDRSDAEKRVCARRALRSGKTRSRPKGATGRKNYTAISIPGLIQPAMTHFLMKWPLELDGLAL